LLLAYSTRKPLFSDILWCINPGLSNRGEVELGVQHILADIMSKNIELINTVRRRYALFKIGLFCLTLCLLF